MEMGWKDVGSGGYILVSRAHSNTSYFRVECTLFCNLQSWARTHAVLVIGLYEVLDAATYLIEPPGALGIKY